MVSKRHGLWQNADFLRLWTAQTVSRFGSHVGHAALEFTAVLNLKATPAQMGLLGACSQAPVLLISLFAGVWVDRARRRPLLITADLGRALLLLSLPLALFLGRLRIELLYLVAALAGALTVLYGVADQSALPGLVRREELVEANSKLGVSESLSEIGGPALGGTLVQWLTAPVALLVDIASFLFSAACIGRIRTPEPPPHPREEHAGVFHEIAAGLGVVWREPALRHLLLSEMFCTFFGSFIGALYSLYLIRELGLTPALVGITVGGGGAGALMGAFLAGPVTRRFGIGPTLIGARLLSTLIGFLVPLAGGPPPVAFAILLAGQIVGDTPGAIAAINAMSLRQASLPHRYLGRASAAIEFLTRGAAPPGALVGGFLGQTLGMRPTLFLAFFGILFACAALLLSPLRRMQGLPAGADV
jgi:Na+/melibiose symporter-like transporter